MSGRARVLVIDDEPVLRRLLARALIDYEVIVLDDARAAFGRLTAGERFDVILCDLNMPEMSGAQFHRALSDIDPSIADRVLFITGGALTDAAELFLEQVAPRVLQKPVEMKQLRESVAALLAANRGRGT